MFPPGYTYSIRTDGGNGGYRDRFTPAYYILPAHFDYQAVAEGDVNLFMDTPEKQVFLFRYW